jgi:hypothetical protein
MVVTERIFEMARAVDPSWWNDDIALLDFSRVLLAYDRKSEEALRAELAEPDHIPNAGEIARPHVCRFGCPPQTVCDFCQGIGGKDKAEPQEPVIGLDVYLDPDDGLKPKLYAARQRHKDEALLQQALEALENTSPLGFNMGSDKKFYAAITALRTALAEQQRSDSEHMEPVGVVEYLMESNDGWLSELPPGTKLFTAPQPCREVELTDEDIGLLTTGDGWSHLETPALALFARAVIAAYRAKQGEQP